MEEKKRKPINSDLFILACLAVVVLFFGICSSFRIIAESAGGCISFSLFGKLELQGVDKMVISVGEEQFVVTDADLLEQVVNETRVATHADHGGLNDQKQIDLYRGDQLVRSMNWGDCCNSMRVYEEDLTHWLIGGKAGYVMLSNDLYDKLDALIALHIQGNE